MHAATDLYEWNAQVGAALYEDLGRLEVIFRNAIDAAPDTLIPPQSDEPLCG